MVFLGGNFGKSPHDIEDNDGENDPPFKARTDAKVD